MSAASPPANAHPAPPPVAPLAFPALLARAVVGGLFAVTGVAKLVDLAKFAEEIQDYELLPIAWTHAAALIVAPLEIVAGVFLVLSLWRCDARLLIALMLAAFTLLKLYAYATGRAGVCGCGGEIPILNTLLENPQGIFTNLALLALLGFDAWQQRRDLSRAAPSPSTPPA